MNIYDHTITESKTESAENIIRAVHNELESKKVFGKKNYFPYENRKLIDMISLFRKDTK